jgi:glycosyltransferase involved in cell wall biosynthesis
VSSSAAAKRVCLVRQAYYPGDPLVRRQAEALVDGGYEVDLVCLRDRGQAARERVEGVEVRRLPLTHNREGIPRYLFEYGAFFVLATAWVAALHQRRRYEVIQVHTMPDLLVFAAFLPRLRGARVLFVMHELMPELFESKFGRGRHRVLASLVALTERLSARFADHIVIVSEPTKEVLVGRGVPPEKVSVVLNAADERLFTRQSRGGGPVGAPIVVTHGTILERSGFETIVRAMVPVGDVRPDVRVRVIGAGEFLPRLRELAEQVGVDDVVDFHGYAPLEQVPALLADATVGVAAVEADEFTDLILPTKLMEYVAIGLPAVAARTRAVEAYFDESMVAFFRPGDPEDLARAVLGLVKEPERARSLAANAADKFLSRHAWSRVKQEYLSIVGSMVGGDGRD